MSVAVMAHKKRASQANSLAKRHNAWISWDRYESRWDTGRRAWWSIANSPDNWGMVLQDDAVPTRGLLSHIPRILEHVPNDSPIVLYTGSSYRWRDTFAHLPRDVSLLVLDRIWWGVAIVLPTHMIEPAIKRGDELALEGHDQYDHILGAYFLENSIPVYYTWPSLVDHSTGPSLIEGRTGRRRAYNFSHRPRQTYDWGRRVVKVETPKLAEDAYLRKGR